MTNESVHKGSNQVVKLDELDLDEYFLTLEKIALMQLEKLSTAGYTEND